MTDWGGVELRWSSDVWYDERASKDEMIVLSLVQM